MVQEGIEHHPNIGSIAAREDIIRGFTQLRAMQQVQGDLCAKNMESNILKYLGTTYVARDVNFLTTVLEGEDALM